MEKTEKSEVASNTLIWLAAGLGYSLVLLYVSTFFFMGSGHGSEEPQRLLFTKFRVFPFWWAGVFSLFSLVRFRAPAMLLSMVLILYWIFTFVPDGLDRARKVADLDFGVPFLVFVCLHNLLMIVFFCRCLRTFTAKKAVANS